MKKTHQCFIAPKGKHHHEKNGQLAYTKRCRDGGEQETGNCRSIPLNLALSENRQKMFFLSENFRLFASAKNFYSGSI